MFVMIPPFSWCFRNVVGDGYDVVAEYFGRGLFNKITVVTEGATEPPAQTIEAPPVPKPAPSFESPSYGPGAEAKMRLTEGHSRQLHLGSTNHQSPGSGVIPIPEGRMRLLEQHQYSSSLEANITRLPEPRVHRRHSPNISPATQRKQNTELSSSPNISSAIANAPANPFGDDDEYDDSKNPFADDEYDESKNPFADEEDNAKNPFGEEDYDKNLNPFS